MKALSAKIDRLCRLIKVSLAILCFLVFVFVSCADYSGNGDGNPSSNQSQRPLPGATALSITLVNPYRVGANLGFQGLAPDLSGAILHVEWNIGPPLTITNMADFFTIPAGITQTTSQSEEFRIGHRGSNAVSAPFTINNIIPLEEMSLTTSGPINWYSDQRPDFHNLGLEGRWVWDDGNQDRTLTRAIPLSSRFPLRDMSRAASDGIVTLSIGTHLAEFKLTNFFQIKGIEFLDASSDFYLYDDQFLGDDPPTVEEVLVERLRSGNVAFSVFYQGEESRVITWREFLENWEYALEATGNPGGFSLPYDIFRADAGFSTSDANGNGILALDGEQTWTFLLEYVPALHGADDYMNIFDVRIPVYVFYSLDSATRRSGAISANISVPQTAAGSTVGIDEVPGGLFETINNRWVLNGTYTRGQGERTRQIPWERNMFSAELYFRPDPPVAPGEIYRDWPLPVTWRGQTITGQSTVQVNIFE